MDGPDFARIRYVTRNYRELQGLSLSISYLSPTCATFLIGSIYGHELEALVLLFLPLMFAESWIRFAARDYYATRFGSTRDEDAWRRALPFVLAAAAAVIFDLARLGEGGRSAAYMVFGIFAVRRVVVGWPWRAHYLLLAAACLAGFIGMPLPTRIEDRNDYAVLVWLTLLAPAILCALLDHWLLVTTLKPGRSSAGADLDDAEEVRP